MDLPLSYLQLVRLMDGMPTELTAKSDPLPRAMWQTGPEPTPFLWRTHHAWGSSHSSSGSDPPAGARARAVQARPPPGTKSPGLLRLRTPQQTQECGACTQTGFMCATRPGQHSSHQADTKTDGHADGHRPRAAGSGRPSRGRGPLGPPPPAALACTSSASFAVSGWRRQLRARARGQRIGSELPPPGRRRPPPWRRSRPPPFPWRRGSGLRSTIESSAQPARAAPARSRGRTRRTSPLAGRAPPRPLRAVPAGLSPPAAAPAQQRGGAFPIPATGVGGWRAALRPRRVLRRPRPRPRAGVRPARTAPR